MSVPAVRILLVEDDQDHAELIRRTLGRQDPPIAVTAVNGGDACLAALAAEMPSAVLLDYSLPGMSGLDVLERIRAAHFSVPVIMVTGQGDERVAVQAMKSGAADYVLKTSGYAATLPTVLHKVLKQHALAEDNERLYAETQRRLRESEALLDLARTLTSTLEYRPLLTAVVGAAARVCAMDRGSICLWEDRRLITVIGQLAQAAQDADASVDALTGRSLDEVRLLDVVAGGCGPVIVDAPGDDPRLAGIGALARAGAILALPLVRRTEIFGALVLENASVKPPVSADQVRLGSTVAAQVSLAVENARLYRAAEQALADLRATQEGLVRGATLRALGEMASGAAHHLNNLLAIVLGRAHLLLADRDIGRFRRPIEIIVRASTDGADVVRRIQEFTRTKTLEANEPVDLDELVAEVIEMTRVQWRDAARANGVSIDVVAETGAVPRVVGHPAALRELLISVLLNAVDALPTGGRITIRTWRAGAWACVAVTDDGVGMTPEVRERAQEPFFTTKGPKSTGLGLSVSGSIVERHGGDLAIESAPGRGTTITIRLPIAAADQPAPAAAPAVDSSPRPLSVLVLDDEEDVREVIAMLLEADGHHVQQVGLPSQALARLEAGTAPDVVLTDLGMPEMTGWDLACAVRERWPSVTIGVVTGWGDHPAPSSTAQAAVNFVISKPIDRAALRAGLRPVTRPSRSTSAA